MGFTELMGDGSFMKRAVAWKLSLGGAIFFMLSLLLYLQVPAAKNHRDIDSGAYVQAANFLLEDGSFARLKTQPYYGLGYPLLLAGVKKMCGEATWVMVLLQIIIALLTIFLVRRIAVLMFDARSGWIAYFLGVCHLGALVFAQFLLTETILVFLLTVCAERVMTFIRTGRHSVLLSAGLALGASSVIKAVGILFIIPLVFLIGIISWRKRKFLRNATLLVAGFLLPVAASYAHNKIVFDGPSGHISMMKINICCWYYPHLRSLIHGTDIWDEYRYVGEKIPRKDLPEIFMRDLKAYPGKALLVWVKNISKTLGGLYTSNVKLLVDEWYTSGAVSFYRLSGSVGERLWGYITGKTHHAWIKILGCYEALFLAAEYCFFACGIWCLYRRREWYMLFFVVLYVGYFLSITGHDGCARFRMMFDMILLACAGGGIGMLSQKMPCKDQRTSV